MKRIKLFLLTVAIAAAGSAFIPAKKPIGDIYVKVGSQFLLKSSQSGICEVSPSSVCIYELKANHSPNQESDFNFNPSENKVWASN